MFLVLHYVILSERLSKVFQVVKSDRSNSILNNLYFVLAVYIILFELTKHGYLDDVNSSLEFFFRLSHFVFAVLSLLYALYNVRQNKVNLPHWLQYTLLAINVVYIILSFIWLLKPTSHHGVNIGVVILGSFVAFTSIGYKISTLYTGKIHPALLFVLSFLFLILLGAIALKLPNATVNDISFLDALFTSTSAVTVTGLAVMDTSKDFTLFGQIIILVLLQLGGIGILTISNLFYLLFSRQSTFKNRIFVSQMTNEINTASAFQTLYKIVSFTVIIETLGVVAIYLSLDEGESMPIFFSIFHAVSAFCNAGFSTLSSSLMEGNYEFNYSFKLIIAWLIITGGIGYNILILRYNSIRNSVNKQLNRWFQLGLPVMKIPKKISLNEILAVRTTGFLLIFGTVLFYFLEFDNTLAVHDGFWHKSIVSFFNSVTTRTAGFNDVDMSTLYTSTVMLFLFLMWIGASPGSTGGGIKTTTLALSVLNLFNQITGRKKVIINYRQVATDNLLVINAIITLSIVTIGLGTFLLSCFESGQTLQYLLFECVSAYSTVGLSLGITASLSVGSKLVIIFLMFVGRVSFLTLLIGIYGQISNRNTNNNVKYPKENVFVN